MPQEARRHHYVPQGYLAGFTDTASRKGRLFALDLQAKRVFQERPKNVAHEFDFNRFEVEGNAPDALEVAYGRFEGEAIPAIRQICRSQQILGNEDEYQYLLNFIALLALRNPRSRRAMTNARIRSAQIIGDLLVADEKLYKYQTDEAYQAGFIRTRDVSFEEMRQFVRAGKYSITIPREDLIASELRSFDNILKAVDERFWSLWKAEEGAPDFITCDHPVTLYYKQAIFPLDTRHAMVGDRERASTKPLVMKTAGVAEVNSRMLQTADRQIYSRSDKACFLSEEGQVVEVALSDLSKYLS